MSDICRILCNTLEQGSIGYNFFFLPACQHECKSSSKHWSWIELKKESLLVIDITVRLFLLMNCISMFKHVCKNSDNKKSEYITNALRWSGWLGVCKPDFICKYSIRILNDKVQKVHVRKWKLPIDMVKDCQE